MFRLKVRVLGCDVTGTYRFAVPQFVEALPDRRTLDWLSRMPGPEAEQTDESVCGKRGRSRHVCHPLWVRLVRAGVERRVGAFCMRTLL
jgi:hypothetical protein